jgi:capsular exopolysaccharide synthesis family protein
MDRIGEALERARRERDARGPAGVEPQANPPVGTPVMPIGLPAITPVASSLSAVAAASATATAVPAEAQASTIPASATPAVARKRPVDIVYTKTRKVTVAEAKLRENRVITGDHHEEFTQAFKILRTQIVHALRDNNWNAIAITSPGDSDGKTVTAINLAIHLAAEVDRTVLLVDANLRQPELHSYFGLTADQGLSDFLVDQVPLQNLMINPGIERLVLLPGGKPLPNSAEMLGSPMMQDLVSELKKRYPQRIVLFDLPPVLTASDALAFAPYVDATILVVAQGHTRHQEIERAAELLGSTTNLLGIVLNKTKPEVKRDEAKPSLWRRWFGQSVG